MCSPPHAAPRTSEESLLDSGDGELYMSSHLYNCTGDARVATVIVDRRSVVPLYYQIQQGLSEQIRSGQLKPGELMPSEQEIAARLGVSRMTARQALKSLCSRGLAFSQRGKGTFVSRMKLEKNFRQLLSFSEEMKDRGSQPRSKVLAFERIHPEDDVVEALHLNPSEEVIFLRTAYLHNGEPVEFVKSTYRGDRCKVVNRLTRQLEIVS